MIRPITVRPNSKGFEIVVGARRYRAAQLAELFYVPTRIVEIDDGKALEWQIVVNFQCVDVHPYEEAQGFERLLDIPGYDVAALVKKSGKIASHVYARMYLLQLISTVAVAFTQERITASHVNLIARLQQEIQSAADERCWRKDWQDKEPHLLPAKHVAAWIQNNLYRVIRREDEDALTQAIILLARRYGRYGYRWITALLKRAGWRAGKDRVERISTPAINVDHRRPRYLASRRAKGSAEAEATRQFVVQRWIGRAAQDVAREPYIELRLRQCSDA